MPEGRRWLTLGGRALLVLAAAVAAAVYAANTQVLDAAAPRSYTDVSAVPPRFAIIVPGAAVHGDVPSDVLEDRLETALAAYKAGRGKRILVSGDHGRKDYDEVKVMRRWLLDHGVSPGDVFMDHAGFRTLDTMWRAHEVFQVKDALIVTQAFHLPRALYLAQAAGLDAVGLAADRRPYVYAAQYAAREALARTLAWLDVHGLARHARYLGPSIPLSGSADSTADGAGGRNEAPPAVVDQGRSPTSP